MYWGLGLLLGTSKKWKVCPIPSSAGNAQNTALNMEGNGGKFWRYLKTWSTKVKKF
jgi:hypothetical protein